MFSLLIPPRQVLEWLPKPVEAVLLVFPITKEFDEMRRSEDEKLQRDGQPHLDPTLFYIKQTVRLSCILALNRSPNSARDL